MDFDRLIEAIIKKLSTMQVDGSFVFSVEFLNKIDTIDKTIEEVLKKEGYYDYIDGFKKEFKDALSNEIKAYSAFGAKPSEILTKFNNLVFENFKNNMIFGFTETSIKQPIKQALIEYVSTNGSYKSFKDTLTKVLEGKKIDTNIDLTARELVFQYKRSQGIQLANKFNVQYFRYVGTEIDTTRSWCQKRIGNIYTKDVIEKWASEDWSGKKAGTNSSNIFTNCGGWGCRHTLQGVSKEYAKANASKINKYNK